MPYDKFLIAPLNSGWQKNVKPWLISDDAFALLRNAYNWRGRVKKRFGGRVMNSEISLENQQLFTRLRVLIGTTDGAGDLAVTPVPGAVFKVGQMFSAGSEKYTVNVLGSPADLLSTNPATTAIFNTTTGDFSLTGGPANTDVYYYPAEPVMNFATYNVVAINDESLFAFDNQFAYIFDYVTGWQRLAAEATLGAATWTNSSDNSDFFSTFNYRGANANNFILFVTNNRSVDAMRYWDGTNWNAWGSLATTPTTGGNFIVTCKVITAFKDRLLLFNTTEFTGAGNETFVNRIRYSWNGNPLAANAWLETPGNGGYIDGPVNQAIIAVQALRDRLIVFFESSTWELVWNNNTIVPFQLQQINSEYGVESPDSIVPFDAWVYGFGQTGIYSCDGMNVTRIDEAIPQEIFEVNNEDNGPQRISGIRDYSNELAYWSYSSSSEKTGYNDIYPNRVLVYNYVNNTWAYNDDSITAFGLFQLQRSITWDQAKWTWEDASWTWQDASQQDRFRSVIAGNQEGWTFVADPKINSNSISLQITDITIAGANATISCVNHNLRTGSYVKLKNIIDDGTIGTVLNNTIWQVQTTSNDAFTIFLNEVVVAGTYLGGGTLTLVSQIEITSKQYNFYTKAGMRMAISEVDFMMDKTVFGKFTVDFYVSTSTLGMVNQGGLTGALIGTGTVSTSPYALYPLENTQSRVWRPMYISAEGEVIQLQIYMTDEQIRNVNIIESAFELNAMMFYATPTSVFGSY